MDAPVKPYPSALAVLQGGQPPLRPPPAEAGTRSEGIFVRFLFASLYSILGPFSTRIAIVSQPLPVLRFSYVSVLLSRAGFGRLDSSQRRPIFGFIVRFFLLVIPLVHSSLRLVFRLAVAGI